MFCNKKTTTTTRRKREREEKISIIEKGEEEEEKSVFVAMEKLIYKYTFFSFISLSPKKIKNFIISILRRKREKKWENFF